MDAAEHWITDEAALAALYGAPSEAAIRKEVDHIPDVYRAFIEAAPFVALASAGPDGLDVSPAAIRPGSSPWRMPTPC